MPDEIPRRQRRVRYKGTHPRHYAERYKELNPERHAEELDKVRARGDTPAGTHRPICVQDVLRILDPRPGDVGLDATLGFGGHAREILPRLRPGGRLIAIDVDPLELSRTEARLRNLGFGEDVLVIRRMNFAGLRRFLPELGGGFDFALADLGASSMQLDNPARGFTYKADGPLDLRFNPGHGRPASAYLRTLNEADLADLLDENADEPYARAVARALHGQPIETTAQLADCVRRALATVVPAAARPREMRKVLQRTFQALRIAVNDEFRALDQFLAHLPKCLKPDGRAAILSFHSGEDRRVKKAFQAGLRDGVYARIASDPIRPSADERRANPRCSSAKLRWAIKAALSG
jgi:16S rRNA (cytosine1402-N4)-methyltransferase